VCFTTVYKSLLVNVFLMCSSLPELLEKKRLVDMHTNVATAILEEIKVTNRQLNNLSSVCNCLFCLLHDIVMVFFVI